MSVEISEARSKGFASYYTGERNPFVFGTKEYDDFLLGSKDVKEMHDEYWETIYKTEQQ